MKKKIDKVRALQFEPISQLSDGAVYGYIWFDVKKLRRTPRDELKEILTEKVLQLYPFAIIDGWLSRYSNGLAKFSVKLPLSPHLRVKQTQED